jgi:predicted dehydrogenase
MAVKKIGSIGLGGIANAVHLPGIQRSPDLEFAALCDIDRERLDRAGDKYGVDKSRRFTDYHEVLALKDVDAVDIAVPNDAHFQIAMDAVSAGKHYAVEKPITLNAAQAETLAKHTAEKGVKSMVCFSYRFMKAARYARDLVQDGTLGDIYHVFTQYFQAGGSNPDIPRPLVWRFIKARAGSGALGDLGCHAIDLVRFIMGKEYTKVVGDADTFIKERPLLDGSGMGKVDVDDYCTYMARMQGGASATFEITRFGFGRGNYQRVEIYGSNGALVYKLNETPDVDELQICIGQPAGQLHAFTTVPLIPRKYVVDQMQSFADILHDKADGLSATIEDGLKNQKTCDAIIDSFENHRWVNLS